jgi:hypothetical protein
MGKPSTKGFKKAVKPYQLHNEAQEELAENLVVELKPQIVSIVERAFKRYADKHGASVELREQEWQRFKRILNGML